MVISGGASLGAYESGYNWAAIKMLSELRAKGGSIRPDLRAVAGASAGSINGLLTAVYWCQKSSVPYKNRVQDNLFFETWVNLDIQDLMILGKDPENKSTLLTRKPLHDKADQILNHMKEPIFNEGCEIPMGFTVTKVIPVVENFDGVEIKNQSFSVPLTLKVKNGKMGIENRTMPESPAFYLSIPGIERDTSKITDVLFASSAFPGGFEQVKLHYTYKGKTEDAYFIDGGVANNIPLDLATQLNPDANTYVMMDPDNVRKDVKMTKKQREESEQKPVGFITSSILPLLSSVSIFRNAKLYDAMHQYFWKNPNRRLVLSSRFHPITGEFLGAFAAFMDKNFRLYDYHVGVYDAIYHLANAFKKRGDFPDKSLMETMDILMRDLGVDKDPEAYTAYKFFLATEFGHTAVEKNNRYATIYYAFNLKTPDSLRYSDTEFTEFIRKLDIRYLPTKPNGFLDYSKKYPNDWAKRPIRGVVNRVTTLENERAEVYPDYTPYSKATSIAAWGGSTFYKDKNGWDILPLNAPRDEGKESLRTALRLLPTEIAADTSNGGISLGWDAYWYHDFGFINGLDLKASFNTQDEDEQPDFVRFDVDIFKEYDDFVKFGVGVSAFGDVEGDFYNEDSAFGGNIYVDFIDIFRLTYVRRIDDTGSHNERYLYFGIENIPSLIYWLYR
jgi:predicted acylesterase/phospholipase RssA